MCVGTCSITVTCLYLYADVSHNYLFSNMYLYGSVLLLLLYVAYGTCCVYLELLWWEQNFQVIL